MRAGARIAGLTIAAVLAGGATASAALPPSTGAGAHAAAAAPVPRSASSEALGLRATLAWSEAAAGPPAASAVTLTLQQSGVTEVVAVKSPHCSPSCAVEAAPGGPPVTVADLEGDGTPVVVVHLNTGGAHCCSIVQFTIFDPAPKPVVVTREHDFGDPGMVLGPALPDRHLELISADDRFAYAFAPYAYSGLPLRVFELQDGVPVDVTRRLPAPLAANAAQQWRGFRATRRQGLGNGLIAAWAADQELLGHGALVRSTLNREARHGNLRSREHYGPTGRKFVQALMRFLTRTGYRR
jgi:hypothetical protein